MSRYTIDGSPVPSVTQVLSTINRPYLATWRGNVGNAEADRVSKLATQYGTTVHRYCESWLLHHTTTHLQDRSQAVRDAVTAFTVWAHEHITEVLAVEQPVYHRTARYAGTPDLVYRDASGRTGVLDFKTSKAIDRLYNLQIVAYRMAIEQDAGIRTEFGAVLRLPRGGSTVEYREFPEHHTAPDYTAFLGALEVYRWLEQNGAL